MLGRKARRETVLARSQLAGALVALIATQTELKRATADYRAMVMLLHEKRLKIAELEEALTPKKRAFSPRPLYMTEQEEDVEWAVGAEVIDPAVAEDILRELDFENSVVHMDEGLGASSLTY